MKTNKIFLEATTDGVRYISIPCLFCIYIISENIEKEYQKLLETLSPEQEEVLTKYCDEIFASGAETEEFFYRLGIKNGLRLKSTVKSVLEMMS